MCERAVILKLISDCALAMMEGGSVVRIRLKDGLREGQTIYVLPEDLLHTPAHRTIAFPGAAKRAIAVAAMLAVCVCMLFLPQSSIEIAAVASFDGAQGLQLHLDENNRVMEALSVDGSIPDEVLKALEGRSLSELGPMLQKLMGPDACLIAYAAMDGQPDPALEALLDQLLPGGNHVYLTGGPADVTAAEEKDLSLGHYIAGQMVSPEQEDDSELDDLELQQLLDLMAADERWTEVPEFREALEERQEDLREEEEERQEEQDEEAEDAEDEEDEPPEEDSGHGDAPSDEDTDEPDDEDDEDEPD